MAKLPKSASQSSLIQKTDVSRVALRFSFRLFDSTDEELCPQHFREGYVRCLMTRLRDLSSWTVREFQTNKSTAIRIHKHDWKETARPKGFGLKGQFAAYEGWQFQLSANEHGRVHGILVDDTFHIIWLDCDHNLYP